MRRVICALSLLGIMGVALAQEAEPGATPPPAPAEQKNSITVSVGAYRMSHATQDVQVTGVAWSTTSCFLLFFCSTNYGTNHTVLANQFDTSAQGALSVDYERQIKYGMVYGGSVLLTQTPFTVPALAPAGGKMTGVFGFGTLGKYFRDPGSLRPFIGVGVGVVAASIGGGINAHTGGGAAEAVAGLRYRTGRISFAAEYRRVATQAMHFGNGTVNNFDGHVNLSGQGAFMGLGIHF